MNELYREAPLMFCAQPVRFSGTVAVVVIAFILAFSYGWLYYPGLIVSIGGALTLGWWFIDNRFTEVTVTEERIIYKTGIFAKTHVEVERASLRTVRVDQTIIDRIFGCGLLKVFSAGDTPEFEQDGLPEVSRLREALRSPT
ncbi:MAG: PH domain-containing protein [Pseudomonadota bacterium]